MSTATGFGELSKLPGMLEHYGEHQSANPSVSFLDFLAMHYADPAEHGQESDHDKKLPFKSPAGNSALCFQCNIIDDAGYALLLPESGITLAFDTSEDFRYSSFPSGIWQPPKLV